VSNSGGGVAATGVSISDELPGEVDFNAGTIRRNTDVSIAGTQATCDVTTGDTATDTGADSDGGAYDSGTGIVSGTLNNVGVDATLGFTFDVTIAPAQTGVDTQTVTSARDTAE
jgi:hypothetical protein